MKLIPLCIFISIVLVGCSEDSSPPVASQGAHYEAHCKEPLPVFTLGADSKPTKEQEEALCACVWENLGSWERKVSKKLAEGKASEVSSMHSIAFPQRFGNAIEKCGGMNL